MTVHLPKLAVAVVTLAISSFWYTSPARAEEEEMSATERFRLCTAFPLNSRCEGYIPPVALKQRPGTEAICKVLAGEIETAGNCKIVLTDATITVYVEYGEKLDLLDDKPDTREISMAVGDVSNLRYRETSKIDIAEVLLITWLAIFKPDKFSEIEIVIAETAQSEISSLTLVTDRELGMNLRTNLERLTGRFAEIPVDEDDKPQEPATATGERQDPEPTDLEGFCQEFPFNSRCQNGVSP